MMIDSAVSRAPASSSAGRRRGAGYVSPDASGPRDYTLTVTASPRAPPPLRARRRRHRRVRGRAPARRHHRRARRPGSPRPPQITHDLGGVVDRGRAPPRPQPPRRPAPDPARPPGSCRAAAPPRRATPPRPGGVDPDPRTQPVDSLNRSTPGAPRVRATGRAGEADEHFGVVRMRSAATRTSGAALPCTPAPRRGRVAPSG